MKHRAQIHRSRHGLDEIWPLDVDAACHGANQTAAERRLCDPRQALHEDDLRAGEPSDPCEGNRQPRSCRNDDLRPKIRNERPGKDQVPDRLTTLRVVGP